MAKPFYSMDEVCELLGKNPDEIRALVRDGELREFRDAGKIFFKAEDIDQLSGADRAGQADIPEVVLEPAEQAPEAAEVPDEGFPSLTSSSGGTSIIGLEPLEEEEKKEEDDKKDTVITASGIGVFDDDELEIDADPMAKTQITAGAVDDQVSLEGSGSGSGLLDLTREADDTSLGAELLDEIYPGEEETAVAEPEPQAAAEAQEEAEPEAEEQAEAELAAADTGEVLAPVLVQAGDPGEGMFSGLLVGSLILLALAGSVGGGVLQGYLPDYAMLLTNNFWFFLGGTGLVVLLSLALGWFVGKAVTPKR